MRFFDENSELKIYEIIFDIFRRKVILEKSKFWSASRVRDLEKVNFHFFLEFLKMFFGDFYRK